MGAGRSSIVRGCQSIHAGKPSDSSRVETILPAARNHIPPRAGYLLQRRIYWIEAETGGVSPLLATVTGADDAGNRRLAKCECARPHLPVSQNGSGRAKRC